MWAVEVAMVIGFRILLALRLLAVGVAPNLPLCT